MEIVLNILKIWGILVSIALRVEQKQMVSYTACLRFSLFSGKVEFQGRDLDGPFAV